MLFSCHLAYFFVIFFQKILVLVYQIAGNTFDLRYCVMVRIGEFLAKQIFLCLLSRCGHRRTDKILRMHISVITVLIACMF